ncbi:hypothetical protein JTB14_000412 [Gonioctena quinquepunctata]|nr:hypothetical protein JTB14_000412 [Gonioctena quinquepunctata]
MVLLDEDVILQDLSLIYEEHKGNYLNPAEYASLFNNMPNKVLNIMHCNIRSIRKNFNEFLAMYETYALYSCDIFILSECFRLESTENLHIPGYDTKYNGGDFNKNDGTVILIKSNLNYNVKNIKLAVSGVTLSILELACNGLSYRIIGLYRPCPSNLTAFIEEIDDFFMMSEVSPKFDFFIGDINIDIMQDDDVNVNKYISVLAKHGFKPYIRRPTRITTDNATCLDHIFVKMEFNLIGKYIPSSFIIECNITDHYPVMININREANSNNHNESNKIILQN